MFFRVGLIVVCATLTAVMMDASPAKAGFIAGTTPSQRPAGAPVIKKFNRSKSWYAQALHGVSKPYPKSLVFLDNQGGWFNPFIRPGMTGKYDLRHWHNNK
jgi:hypothetical protein